MLRSGVGAAQDQPGRPGWGREGGGALPLPSAAAISTRLRVLLRIERDLGREVERGEPRALLGLRSGFGLGFGFGLGL